MVAPMDPSDHLRVAPQLTPSSGQARGWIRGDHPLADDLLGEDAHLYYTEAPLYEIEARARRGRARSDDEPIPVTEIHAREALDDQGDQAQ